MSADDEDANASTDPPATREILAVSTVPGRSLPIRPAGRRRDWMERTPAAGAYRCLPLTMANQHGWELLVAEPFEATWNGGQKPGDVEVRAEAGIAPAGFGHFGAGILSFATDTVFRTPPGYNLWLTGPVNRFKDGIQPMSALIETDWMPFTFSVNWQFTRPGLTVRFERDEPIAQIFPVERGLVESFVPGRRQLAEMPEIERSYRTAFLRRNVNRIQTAAGRGADSALDYQGWYMRGVDPAGTTEFPDHQTALRVRPFPDAGQD